MAGGAILQRSLRGGTLTGKAAARVLRAIADQADRVEGDLDALAIANIEGLAEALASKDPIGAASAAIAAHVADPDPHPWYQTDAEVTATVQAHAGRVDNPHDTLAPQVGALWAPGAGPGGGAVYDARDGGLIMDRTKTPPEQVMAV